MWLAQFYFAVSTVVYSWIGTTLKWVWEEAGIQDTATSTLPYLLVGNGNCEYHWQWGFLCLWQSFSPGLRCICHLIPSVLYNSTRNINNCSYLLNKIFVIFVSKSSWVNSNLCEFFSREKLQSSERVTNREIGNPDS